MPDLTVAPTMFPIRQTSGFFTLSSMPGGIADQAPPTNPIEMHLFVSNYSNQEQSVYFQVDRLTPEGKIGIQDGQIAVPATGADRIAVDLSDLFGQSLQVVYGFENVPQSDQLAPSLVIQETFLADGATQPLLYVAPGSFAIAGTDPYPPAWAADSTVTVTSGMLDVPQGVAAARPQVNITLDNSTGIPQKVTVVINKLLPESTEKQNAVQMQVTVPGGQALTLPIDAGSHGIEGSPAEILLTLPTGMLGVPLIQPSVNFTLLFTADGTVQELLFIGPTAFRIAATATNRGATPVTTRQATPDRPTSRRRRPRRRAHPKR